MLRESGGIVTITIIIAHSWLYPIVNAISNNINKEHSIVINNNSKVERKAGVTQYPLTTVRRDKIPCLLGGLWVCRSNKKD